MDFPDLLPFLPDLALLALAMLVLVADLSGEDKPYAFHLAWIGLACVAFAAFRAAGAGAAGAGSFAGYLADADRASWKLLFALAGLGTALLSRPYLAAGGGARGNPGGGGDIAAPPVGSANGAPEGCANGAPGGSISRAPGSNAALEGSANGAPNGCANGAPGGNSRGPLGRPGAFLGLLLLSVQGMFALVSATDLLTFYLGLELATLPVFALVAFQPGDADSAEAGAKYVLMGGFSSALTLFGISFLYGAAGSLGFEALSHAATVAPSSSWLRGGIVFLLGGIGFKLAMAPLHMWAPDVYQGAPTPVAAFLSVGSKAAAVAAAATLFLGPLDPVRAGFAAFLMAGAVLSMIAGNLGAMRPSDLRRFVAYSSIAQVGYMLVGLVGEAGAARLGLRYNLLAYGVASFALFFIMSQIGAEGPETVPALRGLSRRHPGLAALLVLAMFSLTGVPPLAGFLGKFLLFNAAVQEGHYLLVGVALANAVVSFYYYMRLVKEAYMADREPAPALILGWRGTFALWGLGAALVVLGVWPAVLAWFARN